MLPKIHCEICSGKLLGIPNSLFVCKACGVEYTIEWARAKYCEAEGLIPLEPEPTPPDSSGIVPMRCPPILLSNRSRHLYYNFRWERDTVVFTIVA